MSKLSKIPNIFPSKAANIKAQNALPSNFSMRRITPRVNMFKKMAVDAPHKPSMNNGHLHIEQATANIFNNDRSVDGYGMGGYNSLAKRTTSSIKSLDGTVAHVVCRADNVDPTTLVSFIADAGRPRLLNTRYQTSVLVKVTEVWKTKSSLYLRWVGIADDNFRLLPTVRYIPATKEVLIETAEDYDVRAGVEELPDGWVWLWICTDTPAGKTAQVHSCLEVGIHCYEKPAVGEELFYFDYPHVSNNPTPVWPIVGNGQEVSSSADVIQTDSAFLSGTSLAIEFKPQNYARKIILNRQAFNIAAGWSDILLCRQGITVQIYANGSPVGTGLYSSDISLNIQISSGAMDVSRIRFFNQMFDDETAALITFKSPGIASAFAKALATTKAVDGRQVAWRGLDIIAAATGLPLKESDVELITGVPVYLEFGATTTVRVKARPESTVWSGEVDVTIRGEVIDGVGMWLVSLSAGGPLNTVLNHPILRMMGTHVTGLTNPQFNSYHYDVYNNELEYTVQAGDTLEYEIYFPLDETGASMDCRLSGTNGLPELRHRPEVVDQNGMSAHPAGPLYYYATRQWYKRVFNLQSLVGETMSEWTIALENEGDRTTIVYLRNVVIRNSQGVIVAAPFLDRLVVPQPMTWSLGGSVNYKDILKAVLSPSEAIGVVPIV